MQTKYNEHNRADGQYCSQMETNYESICAMFILDDDADVLAWPNKIAKKIQFQMDFLKVAVNETYQVSGGTCPRFY